MKEILLKESDIRKVEAELAKGYRVELLLLRDGVKIVRVQRKEVKN